MNVYIYCYLLAGQTFGFDILIDSCKYIFWKVNGCAELPARSTRKKWKKNEIKNEWMDGLICIYLSAFPTDEHDIWLIYFLFMVLFAANSRYFRINIRGIFSYLLATKTKRKQIFSLVMPGPEMKTWQFSNLRSPLFCICFVTLWRLGSK